MEVLFAKTETGIRFLHTCALRRGTEHHGYLGPPHTPPVKHGTIIYEPDAFFQTQFGKQSKEN